MGTKHKFKKWIKSKFESKVKEELEEIAKKNEKGTNEVINKISDMIEREPEEKQKFTLAIIMAGMLCGFEDYQDRRTVLGYVETITEEYHKNE